ncbi:MAG: hypothetical protein ABFD24_03550 [Anaerolineaceae bacterium]
MTGIILAIFIILHGLVHFLYFGQSLRLFILQPGMVWPEGSWVLAHLVGSETIRVLASIFLAIAGLSFIIGGIGLFLKQTWFHPVVIGTAAFSILIFFLFWNGKIQNLDSQGVFAILINLAIIAFLLFLEKTFIKL